MSQSFTINHANFDPNTPVGPIDAKIHSHDTAGLGKWSNLSITIGPYPNQTTIEIRDDADMSAAWALYEALGIAIQDARRLREEAIVNG